MTFDDIRQCAERLFPKKKPRSNQLDTIAQVCYEFLVEKKKHVILDAPTGSGKSVIAYTIGKVMAELYDRTDYLLSDYDNWSYKVNIVTSNKNLQKQYMEDFSIYNLWGKTTYACHHGTVFDSPDCFILRKDQICSDEICPYATARRIWLSAPLRLTNMSFQIEACDLITNKVHNKASLIIVDECHVLGEKIQEHCKVSFPLDEAKSHFRYVKANTKEETIKYLKDIRKLMDLNTTNDIFKIYDPTLFSQYASFCEVTFESLKYIRDSFDTKKDRQKIFEISKDIDFYGNQQDQASLMEMNVQRPMLNDNDILRPIFPGSFAWYALYKKTEKVLHMSATICNPESYAKEVGIKDYSYIKIDNEFPVENRMIYVKPVQKVSTSPLNKNMFNGIDWVLNKYPNDHGIIHTVSYSRANEVLQNCKTKGRMVVARKKEEIMEILKKKDNTVIISPVMVEGFDLKDDLSRFQIIVKVPYESIADKLNELTFKLNKDLYFRRAVLKVVQMSGRSIRHENDKADTYILDGAFLSLIKNNGEVFPDWFVDAIKLV